MRLIRLLLASAPLAASVVVACSGSSSSDQGAGDGNADSGPTTTTTNAKDASGPSNVIDASGSTDSGLADTDSGADGGADIDAYLPPLAIDVPSVTYNGGSVIVSPSLVTVTFANETIESQIEAFDDTIGTTPWWDAARAGYCDSNKKCIGQAVKGGHVRLGTNAKGSYTDTTQTGGASTIQTTIAG